MRKSRKSDRTADRQQQADQLADAIRKGDLSAAAELLKSQTKDKALSAASRPAAPDQDAHADTGADSEAGRAADAAAPADAADTTAPSGGVPAEAGGADTVPLPGGLGGGMEEIRTFEAAARVYQVHTPLADLPGGRALAGELDGVLRGARQRFDELDASPGLCHVADASADDVLLARAEACPIHVEGNEAVGLLGLLVRGRDGWVVEQSVARHPAEEAGVMLAFAVRRDASRVIVTYPAQTSQYKLLRKRCETCDIERPDRWPAHLDLRKEARRVWQRRLPNYKLATLAHVLLNSPPPSGLLSANAARRVLRRMLIARDAAGLPRLLDQNRRELTAMARVLCLLLTGCDPLP